MKTVKTVVIATLMAGLAAPALADHHGRHAGNQDTTETATQKGKELHNHHNEETGKPSRRAKAAGEKEQERLEERREEAGEKAAKTRKQAEDAAGDNEGQGRPDVPPGLAGREEHPSAGHGSEQGQESRTKQEKKWWQFWQ